jgi:hypothetical protein
VQKIIELTRLDPESARKEFRAKIDAAIDAAREVCVALYDYASVVCKSAVGVGKPTTPSVTKSRLSSL